jgi:NAD(P)H-nitrite reductase large subunit
MACTTQPLPVVLAPAEPRAMTRCECAGMTFAELAHRVRAEGLSPEEACHRTGCGQTCTACVPDLKQYLAGL